MEARSDGLSFCEMADEELVWSADQIMIRGASMYGCKLPETDFLGQYISEEVRILINDFGFTELTLSEILLALRINQRADVRYPSGNEVCFVEFKGDCFNTKFLSDVLTMYINFRQILDRKIQNHIDGY